MSVVHRDPNDQPVARKQQLTNEASLIANRFELHAHSPIRQKVQIYMTVWMLVGIYLACLNAVCVWLFVAGCRADFWKSHYISDFMMMFIQFLIYYPKRYTPKCTQPSAEQLQQYRRHFLERVPTTTIRNWKSTVDTGGGWRTMWPAPWAASSARYEAFLLVLKRWYVDFQSHTNIDAAQEKAEAQT